MLGLLYGGRYNQEYIIGKESIKCRIHLYPASLSNKTKGGERVRLVTFETFLILRPVCTAYNYIQLYNKEYVYNSYTGIFLSPRVKFERCRDGLHMKIPFFDVSIQYGTNNSFSERGWV